MAHQGNPIFYASIPPDVTPVVHNRPAKNTEHTEWNNSIKKWKTKANRYKLMPAVLSYTYECRWEMSTYLIKQVKKKTQMNA